MVSLSGENANAIKLLEWDKSALRNKGATKPLRFD